MIRARWILAAALALGLAGHGRDRFDAWVAGTVLPPLVPETSVEVRDRAGLLLRPYTVADGRWRLAVDAGAVDPRFIAMLIAYEDKRFYSHAGVDPLALLRAAGQALRHGRVVSGGSTLTMQVARLLEEGGTSRLPGKLRQARVALALERRLTKAEILTLYLHLAPYGGNLEGVRAATLAYFGKEPRRLTPAEAALLVALPQAPESRRPDRSHDRAVAARARVLDRMAGAGLLTGDQARAALREAVPRARRPFPALAQHVADRVRAADPGAQRHELTLERSLQARLEELAAAVVAEGGDRMQIAILVADHRSGAVLASVGSSGLADDARQGFVDMTLALRSPGSTLKPLVYGLAFDEGLAHPETLIDDRPVAFGSYRPQNFDHLYRGTVRVREALQLSLNIPVVTLTEALGPARLVTGLRRAGVAPVIPGGRAGLAVALGGVGVTLVDLVQLYGAIARGGVVLPLHVTGEGGEGQRVLSARAAWQVADILSGLAPPPGAPENRLAYKTGTSYGHRDAWAIGFDGRHVVGVWMGRADGTPVPGAFGADLAAPVLFQALARVKPRLDPLPAPPPDTILATTAELPPPLRRFRPRGAVLAAGAEGPKVAFPPDGAVVERIGGAILARVRGGAGPFTWLVDGRPIRIADRGREGLIDVAGPGFLSLTVIDSTGQSARSTVEVK